MTENSLVQKFMCSARHRTAYLETGPVDGPLIFFLHGWPELGIIWRSQMEHFSRLGWRCVAPDMRGYGTSTVHGAIADYALREIVTDMTELHDALGGGPAIWVGHDAGSRVAWSMASHHADRCRGVASLTIPYIARGFCLPNLVPLIDREVYPTETFPVGQWEYWLYYREHFTQACGIYEADVPATMALMYRRGNPDDIGKPAKTAFTRINGGWFGGAKAAPASQRDESFWSQPDFDHLVKAFSTTGFAGATSAYMNEAADLAYAAQAQNFGRLSMPALFIHAAQDVVCDTIHGRLAVPMREDCSNLTEATIEGGHMVMLEKPDETNAAIAAWLSSVA